MRAEGAVAIMAVVGEGYGGEDTNHGGRIEKEKTHREERKEIGCCVYKIALCFKCEISKLPIMSVLCPKFRVHLSLLYIQLSWDHIGIEI